MNVRVTRIGIAINWTHLRDLMKQYLDERGEEDEAVLRQIALSDFLFWLKDQQRQETRNGPNNESKGSAR